MAPAGERIRLTLYGRRYCHLCDDMLAALDALAPELGFSVDVVDVDSAPELEARYGPRVPVLAHGDAEICHYLLDGAALERHLRQLAASGEPFR